MSAKKEGDDVLKKIKKKKKEKNGWSNSASGKCKIAGVLHSPSTVISINH